MSNEIKAFENAEFGSVRGIEINGEPWLVGKDVCNVLNYSNPTKALKDHVDAEDMTFNETLKLSRQSGAWLINESGFYSLVFSSEMPKAKNFKHWVTSEVLPSIRKTGSYSIQQKVDSYMIEDSIARAKRWIEEEEERRTLKLTVENQKPMVMLAEERIDKKGCYSLTDVTKSLHFKRGQITRWAKSQGFIHKTLTEVNNKGEEHFKVYSTDGIHNQIGITESGLDYINKHACEISEISSSGPASPGGHSGRRALHLDASGDRL